MKLTKKLQTEIHQVMDDYWNSYFSGDIDHWATYLVNDYRNIGGTDEEIWNSKKEILDYTHRVIDQMKGVSEIRNKQIQIIPYDPYWMVHEFLDIYIKIDDQWTFYQKFRLSSLIQKTNAGWKVLHQHGSYPDSKTMEGEAFAFDLIKNENKKLHEAIKVGTTELKQKNRELEIEAALERVRAIAMGMRKPDDMLDICSTIAKEFADLGIKEIRNVQTAIFYDEKSFYTNYEYYAKHDKVFITQTEFRNHQLAEEFAEQMMKGPNEFFTHSFFGQEVKDWLNYQKTTNVFIDTYLETASSLNYYWYSLGPVALGVSTYQPLTQEENQLFQRFRNVFELAYKRYIDITNAEAQARESQIQLALERVRARTMAMHNSEDVSGATVTMFTELEKLGIENVRCGIAIVSANKTMEVWSVTNADGKKTVGAAGVFDMDSHKLWQLFFEVWHSQSGFMRYYLTGKEKEDYIRLLNSNSNYLSQPIREMPDMDFQSYQFKEGSVWTFSMKPHTAEEQQLMKRFTAVFSLTFRRYLDLQKAEAQAREAQIQLSLERVRARAMAMQKSDELKELIGIVFTELTKLDLVLTRCLIMIYDTQTNDSTWWMANSEAPTEPIGLLVKYHQLPPYTAYINAWQERKNKWQYILEATDKKDWDDFLFVETELSHLPDFVIAGMKAPDRVYLNASFNNFGNLTLATLEPLSDEHFDILLRFAKVFDLTYTRFNDLKQAEAQVRESQIQLALERVRARTMAMQTSEELKEVASLMFQQIQSLGIPSWSCGYNIFQKEDNVATSWMSNHGQMQPPFQIPLTELSTFIRFKTSKENGEEYWIEELKGGELKDHYDYLFSLPGVEVINQENEKNALELPTYQINHVVNFSEGNLLFITYEQVPEAQDIFRRFWKTFEQTYIRFLDLQRVEAQARESKIQLALERVRARTMAMQSSDELAETAAVVFKQLIQLGIEPNRLYIGIINDESGDLEFWITDEDGNKVSKRYVVNIHKNISIKKMYEAWKEKKNSLTIDMKGQELKAWVDYWHKEFGVPFKEGLGHERRLQNLAYFSKGFIATTTFGDAPQETLTLLDRFAAVFNLTYTRFSDLQQAEAQAREAQIEAALERVRSRTLAMQKSDELAETSAVLFQQLIHLGISPNRLYINIIKNEDGDAEFWITDEDGSKVSMAYEDNMLNNSTFKKMFDGWKDKKSTLVIDMHDEELKEYFRYLTSISVPFKGGLAQKRRLQYIAYFSKGFIGMASPDEQSAETLQLLERFAYVFNLTFTRFNDLQLAEAHAVQAEQDLIEIKAARKKAEDTLTELQQTQKQLIQSEKMASLGELTAGIAHEIQNPLNFVNNFSELNKELVDELNAEADKGNIDEVKTIAKDIRDNEEKINFHGKRADAIVKGMLQHSRASSGKKEPTDINALADEYLRLSYHGLRAKDKSFNAKFETDFDNSIGKINIVPQDIGRVTLNLINNAFYAVTEKKKQNIEGYEPTVTVTTMKSNGKVEIRVKDNGIGIQQKVMDKIFQPFFTTKPTGQGTGLGLSLAYDIVKAHGGEIKTETKEGEGSEFVISLPV